MRVVLRSSGALLALALISACGASQEALPEPGVHGTAGVGWVLGQGVVTNTDLKIVLRTP